MGYLFRPMGDRVKGEGLLRPTLITLEVFNVLLTMSLGDFIRHLKLFSLMSLSWSGSAILDFTTFLQNAKNSENLLTISLFVIFFSDGLYSLNYHEM